MILYFLLFAILIQSILRLNKVKTKNEIDFKRLSYHTSSCHGWCPVTYLEINNNGDLYFYGKENTDLIGIFRGNLPQRKITRIQELINKIDFKPKNHEASFHSSIIRDGPPSSSLIIKTKNAIWKKGSNNFSNESPGIDRLCNYLAQVRKEVILVKDSNAISEFKLRVPKELKK